MSVTLEVSQVEMVELNEVALLNLHMVLLVSHLQDRRHVHRTNAKFMSVTLEVSHSDRSWLKLDADENLQGRK